MPALYPGLAPLTVNTVIPAGPGVLVSAGGSDPHGVWPTPNEMIGGDPRFAAYLMAAVESVTSRTNFIGWRVPDLIAGGDYRTLYKAQTSIGNALIVDHSGSGDNLTAVTGEGGSAGGFGGDFYGGGTGGALGVRGTGAPTGIGVVGVGGSTSGVGGTFTAIGSNSNGLTATGHGSGPGAQFSAGATADTPAVLLQNGPISMQGYTPAYNAALPSFVYAAKNFVQAWCEVTTTASGTPSAVVDSNGRNFTAVVTYPTVSPYGAWGVIAVNFATAMPHAHYTVYVSATNLPYLPIIVGRTTTFIQIAFLDLSGPSTPFPTVLFTGSTITFTVSVSA